MQSEKFIPFSSSVGSFFPNFSHPSGSLEVLESRKVLVHCWNPKKTAKLWQKICIPETLKKLVQLPSCSSKEKTSGFSVPFVFQQLQDGKPPCLCLSYLLNVNHYWRGGGGERNQNMQLFYFKCQKILRPRPRWREASHFSDFRSWHSREWVPEPGVWRTHLQCCAQKGTTQLQPWCWHFVVAFLSFGAVFCLPLAEV